MFVTIIGRGHSGTRAISHTLTESGVYMGAELNESGDLIPADNLYKACRIMSKHIQYLGENKWDFSPLHTMKINPEFVDLVNSYLESVITSPAENKGWKLPETMLIYPWIVRLFPEAKYIFWVRDPRDNILGEHLTDNLLDFGIPYEKTENLLERRAISWLYQFELYKATPRPKNLLEIRFEDFVLKHDETLEKIEAFLEIHLKKIEVRSSSVGRWKESGEFLDFPQLEEGLKVFSYD